MEKHQSSPPVIPLRKQTKRRQKAANSSRRAGWGDVVPVTRVVPSGKSYRRQDTRRAERKAMTTEA